MIEIQRRAFGRVADAYGVDVAHMPPLQESAEDLARLMREGSRFVVADAGPDGIVGAARATARADGSVEIGRLAVEDGWEGRGIGAALMLAAEDAWPEAQVFELFTGKDHWPLPMYERLGYRTTRTESFGPWSLVWMTKHRARPGRVD